jgi:probable F420-dependent oxidoreductase
LPQRNVFVLAKQVATLDLLSGGRFTLGIGVGWREDELSFLGVDLANRGAITDEAVEVLRTLWREPKASFDGQFHQFSNALLFPKPTSGGPPIWVGGNTHAAIRRAAAYGDAWVPFGLGVNDLKAGIKKLRELTQGRAVPTIASEMTIHVHIDGKSAPKPRAGFNTVFNITVEGYPEKIIQVLQEYQQAGLEYVICIFYADRVADLIEQMQVFAEQVVPQFSEVV